MRDALGGVRYRDAGSDVSIARVVIPIYKEERELALEYVNPYTNPAGVAENCVDRVAC